MYLNYFESSNGARLSQIMDTLKNVHGVTINIDRNSPSAEDLLNKCLIENEVRRDKIINESSFNSYQQNPEYIKCMLILEAVTIMLTEIAPKRRRKNMSESIDEISKNNSRFINQNLATQLKDVSAKIPQSSSDFGSEAAFANSLSLIAQKISGEDESPLDDIEKSILSMLAKMPRPVKVPDFIRSGIDTFGTKLADKRKNYISTLPKVDVSEQDQDGDGDEDFADIQIARMTTGGMSKSKAIAMTKDKQYNKESAEGADPMKQYRRKHVQGLHNHTHYEDPKGNWVQVSADKKKVVHHDKSTGKMTDFDDVDSLKAHLLTNNAVTESDIGSQVPSGDIGNISPRATNVLGQAHHYEYQASMARSELYRNAKYAMSMIKQVEPNAEIEPWIAGALTKSANILDKVYHYLDYYKKFEPEKLPEDHHDVDLGETSGSIARQNLMMIMEYSTKLFEMIKPGDKLEGWVAMKLTTASECVSSCKHYMDYVQFENHAMVDHFDEGRKAAARKITETTDPLVKVAASMISPKGVDRRDVSNDEWETLKRVAGGKYSGADRAKASKLITTFRKPNMKLPESTEFTLNEETDIARAATIIDAKNMAGDLQDMAEKVARASVDDLMPLVDIMRTQFGSEAAEGFNNAVKPALEKLLDLTTKTKEEVEKAVDTINKGGIPEKTTDMEIDAEIDSDSESSGDDTDISKDLDALASATEEEPEGDTLPPLGREKKEIGESATSDDEEEKQKAIKSYKGPITVGKTRVARGAKYHRPGSGHVGRTPGVADADAPGISKMKENLGSKLPPIDSSMNDTVNEAAKSAKDPGAVATAKVKKMGKTYWTGTNLTKKGIRKRDEIIRAIEKENVSETVVNEYAPKGAEAEEWIRKNKEEFINRYGKKKGTQVLYATAWKMFGKKKESFDQAKKTVAECQEQIKSLQEKFDNHRNTFDQMIMEGKAIDPLNVGHGLEGDIILKQISEVQQNILNARKIMKDSIKEGIRDIMTDINSHKKERMIKSIIKTTPYGVIYETLDNIKLVKMFETISTRDYWIKMHEDSVKKIRLINPENLQGMISKPTAGI